MKKFIIYITIFALLFVYSGCGKDEAETTPATSTAAETTLQTDPGTEPTVVPTETEPPVAVVQQPMTAVYLPVQIEDTVAEDGTVLFRRGQQSMVLTAEDPDVADRIILDFLNRTDNNAEIPELIETARQQYADSVSFLPLYQQTVYSAQRIDSGILSLYGIDLTFQGAVHPTTICKSVTYDLLTGNVLSLGDILTGDTTMDTLCEKVTTVLDGMSENLFPDYASLVSDLFNRSISEYSDWYLSSEGLCFYFNPYEIANYSAGNIIATVPYSALMNILQDAYFPPEEDVARGTLSQSAFGQELIGDFTQIAEVPLGTTGRKVVLYTDYSIHDIRITQKSPSIGNPDYEEAQTVFAAAGLTPGDAIVITVPENTEVTVSYISNGQTYCDTV